MTTKTTYAVIAAIIIAVVAIGAAVVFSGNDSISGTYELREGSFVTMNGDDVSQADLAGEKVTVRLDSDGFITMELSGLKVIGKNSNGMIRFTSAYSADGGMFHGNWFGRVDGNVIYYSSLLVNEDSSATCAVTAALVKEGTDASLSQPEAIVKEGTVFESYDIAMMIDGEPAPFDSYSMEVEKNYGSISVLKNRAVFDGKTVEYKALAIRTGESTMETWCNAKIGFAVIVTDGELAQLDISFTSDGSIHTQRIDMSSTDKIRTYVPSEELEGKVYRGVMDTMYSDGRKISSEVSYSLGDDDKGIFQIYGTDSGVGFMIQAVIVPDVIGNGYFVMFNEKYPFDGATYYDVARGYISADLKQMTVSYVHMLSDGKTAVSESVMKLADEKSILGTYYLRDGGDAIMVGNEVVYRDLIVPEMADAGTVNWDLLKRANPHASEDGVHHYIEEAASSSVQISGEFVIKYFDGVSVKAVWNDIVLRGFYDGGSITFAAMSGGFIFNCNALIKDGVLHYGAAAINEDDTVAYACCAVFAKKDAGSAVIPEDILVKGDVYKSVETAMTVDGTPVDFTHDVTVQILDSRNGIYQIEYADESAGNTNMFLAVRNGDRCFNVVCANEFRFSDICIDRDVMAVHSSFNQDGSACTLSDLLLKGDDTSSSKLPSLNGLVFTGTSRSYASDGRISDCNLAVAFGSSEEEHVSMKIIVGGNASVRTVMLFPNVDSDGCIRLMYQYDDGAEMGVVRGYLSSDFKTLRLVDTTFGSDGTFSVNGGVYGLEIDGDAIGS